MITKADINIEEFNARFSRLLHRFIARKLVTDPEMVDRAREYLRLERAKGCSEWYWWIDEWLEILNRPVLQLRRDITKDNDRWDQLRSVSPFSMVHNLDFTDLQWRRRAIRKVRNGLVLVRNSQYERIIHGPYRGDSADPRSLELNSDAVFDRYCLIVHRVIARLIVNDEGIVSRYRQRLIDMNEENRGADGPVIDRWIAILEQPIEAIRRDIVRRGDEWDKLRRYSGLLEYVNPRVDRQQITKIWRLARMGLMIRNYEISSDVGIEENGTSNTCRP